MEREIQHVDNLELNFNEHFGAARLGLFHLSHRRRISARERQPTQLQTCHKA